MTAPLALSDYEAGLRLNGDYAADLRRIQRRLARIQAAYIMHRKAAIIVFEGWDAAGKGGVIRRLTAAWDPRSVQVWPIAAPSAEARDHHFLWRFWPCLPAKGHIGVFDRSWYGRVLVERVEGLCSGADWTRAYDEINEFEAQQCEAGATLIKIFLHVTAVQQDKRFKARLADPWKRWKITPEDLRNRAKRAAYLDAYADMFARTHTRWAPWTIIDGNAKKAARIAALIQIADQLEAGVDMTAVPLDPEVAHLAAALGDDGHSAAAQSPDDQG